MLHTDALFHFSMHSARDEQHLVSGTFACSLSLMIEGQI